MKIIKSVKEMSQLTTSVRKEGKAIGFVPTMGALHEGHLELVRLAQKKADFIVVSVFVNPIQFGPHEDFNAYPRDLKGDCEKLEKEKVDILFYPESSHIYPPHFQTFVSVEEVSKGLCGGLRPGHFKGVATVLLKLFNIVKPTLAVFGEKDYQQLLVIKKMVQDLNLDIEIFSHPTIREKDGLAMSSRNQRLSQEERHFALIIPRALKLAGELYDKGLREPDLIITKVKDFIDREGNINLQYLEIRDAETLRKVSKIEKKVVLALAALVGKVRLIDNCIIGS